MNILKLAVFSVVVVSTGVFADTTIKTEHLKNKAEQQEAQVYNRTEETTHKVKNRLEEKKLQAENRLKNGGEATTTDKVKENSQKAWNR
ncbi:hypothetical protein LCK17_005118, partial [Salmonella enterica]|nr:hypothetical protein [Salmonella enterica]EID9281974.1 hypothetical protein [Salmonella enterica]